MRKLVTMMFLLVAATAWAQNAVTIHQADGKVTTFLFSDKPTVTYSGNDLVLTTTKTAVQYPIYMLKKLAFRIESVKTAIEEVKEKQKEVKFSFADGAVMISGGEANTRAYLYDIGGMVIGECQLDSNGCGSIAISSLNKGLYLLKTSSITFKIRKP